MCREYECKSQDRNFNCWSVQGWSLMSVPILGLPRDVPLAVSLGFLMAHAFVSSKGLSNNIQLHNKAGKASSFRWRPTGRKTMQCFQLSVDILGSLFPLLVVFMSWEADFSCNIRVPFLLDTFWSHISSKCLLLLKLLSRLFLKSFSVLCVCTHSVLYERVSSELLHGLKLAKSVSIYCLKRMPCPY